MLDVSREGNGHDSRLYIDLHLRLGTFLIWRSSTTPYTIASHICTLHTLTNVQTRAGVPSKEDASLPSAPRGQVPPSLR